MPPPLITAIKEKKLEEVKRLVSNGADLEVVDQKYQESVLFNAIKCMDKEILDVILSKKHDNGIRVVDVNKINSRTWHTPLHWAIVNRNFNAVEKLLLCPDIKLNEKNKRGNTPLHMAVDKNFINVVWALAVQQNINFDALNLNKCRPEDVNLGGPESQKARKLLKMCREYIKIHPDKKFLLVKDIEEIRYTMRSGEDVDLPEVKRDYKNNIYVSMSNVTAKNIIIAGNTVQHHHGDSNVRQGTEKAQATNAGPGAVEITPNPYSIVQQQNIPSHMGNQPNTRDLYTNTRDELPPSYDEVTSSFNQRETYDGNIRPQHNSRGDRFHEVMVDLKIN